MAQLDPNIILRGFNPPPLEDPLENAAKAYTLKNQIMQAQNQERQFRMQDALRQSVAQSGGDIEKAMRAALSSGNIEAAAKLAPLLEVQRKSGQQQQGQSIGSGGLRLPDGTIVPPASRPDVPTQVSALAKLIRERDTLPAGDPKRQVYNNAIRKESETARQISPSVNLSMPQPVQPIYEPKKEGGFLARDARTGKVISENALPPGAVVDPALRGRAAEAISRGRAVGEAGGQAEVALPHKLAAAEETINLADELLKHPGLDTAVGMSSLLGIQYIPGTNAKAFMVRLKQVVGKQFMEAYTTLKGGGQITEIEGQKATEAMARMDNANTEEEFKKAVDDYKDVVKKGISRARAAASKGSKSGWKDL